MLHRLAPSRQIDNTYYCILQDVCSSLSLLFAGFFVVFRGFTVEGREQSNDSIPHRFRMKTSATRDRPVPDPAQSELGDGDHQEQQAKRKQKRLKNSCSKSQ